ncbi:hypothetical protein [Burkholderia gladioli]|uniref:hypothetical protein n=1 Tax=Burkholderia gladioli TaxID=28095 RepID=UPI00163E5804|nr:hypothetical protein [Burkholderia gladioli]
MTNNTTAADLDRDIAHLIDSSENGIARVPRETLVRLRELFALQHSPIRDEQREAARKRVAAFMDAYSILRGADQEKIHSINFTPLLVADLRALLTSPRAAVPPFSKHELTAIRSLLVGSGYTALMSKVVKMEREVDAAPAAPVAEAKPIPMLLFCPRCGTQHIDAPEDAECDGEVVHSAGWSNPPHRSHLCHACDCIWRPADVATVGVEAIETRGKADTWTKEMPWIGHNRPVVQAVAADGTSAQRCNLGVGCDEAGVCYALAHGDVSQCGRAAVSPATASGLPAWFDTFLTNVCEIPDRSSPEGEPDAIIATLEELKNCALNAIEECAGDEPATADERAHNACCPFCGSDDFYTDWALGKRQALCNSCEAAGPTEETDEEAIASFTRMRASQAAAPAEAREPLVLWQDGTGMLWDTYSHGKWMHRFVSPHGWDAHGVAQHLYGKGYAGHLEVRAVWSGNYAVPADAGEAVDAARYRVIRTPESGDAPRHGSVNAIVYEHIPGTIPSTRPVWGDELDRLADAARVQGAQAGKGGEA